MSALDELKWAFRGPAAWWHVPLPPRSVSQAPAPATAELLDLLARSLACYCEWYVELGRYTDIVPEYWFNDDFAVVDNKAVMDKSQPR